MSNQIVAVVAEEQLHPSQHSHKSTVEYKDGDFYKSPKSVRKELSGEDLSQFLIFNGPLYIRQSAIKSIQTYNDRGDLIIIQLHNKSIYITVNYNLL